MSCATTTMADMIQSRPLDPTHLYIYLNMLERIRQVFFHIVVDSIARLMS